MNTAAILNNTTMRRYRAAMEANSGSVVEQQSVATDPRLRSNGDPLAQSAVPSDPSRVRLIHPARRQRRGDRLPGTVLPIQPASELACLSSDAIVRLRKGLSSSPYHDIRALQIDIQNDVLEIIGVVQSYYHKQLVIENFRSTVGTTIWIDRMIVDPRH